ncbi:hypothetical protein ABT154_01250 [Streptomyces sp. NPDC001728]|uniref:hypothetical protein n=1 Tax=Streptomyces sp. NPDC001728 TaxID=3154396 RepID=UPI00332A3D11
MHTAVSPFVLQPWQEGDRHARRAGWRGVSREFGEITLTCPLPRTAPETVVSEARGGLIPVVTFEARGVHTDGIRLPTLNRSTLRVGDRMVCMTRNRWGATAARRALALRYAGDRYRLSALDKRAYVLTREPDEEDPGLTVTVRASGRGRKRQLAVRVGGRAEGGDLALALVFAGVDRSALTRMGAVRAGVSRITDLWAESQY